MPSAIELRDRVRGWLRRKPKVVVPRTILVVDGNTTNRQATARVVESLGYQALQTPSIAEAIKQIETQDPHFVLLGFDLDPGLSIIMLAADLWDNRAAEAMRRGAVAYLARPFDRDDLRELLLRR
jgi:CheY-like chemotaxis protein